MVGRRETSEISYLMHEKFEQVYYSGHMPELDLCCFLPTGTLEKFARQQAKKEEEEDRQ